MRKIIVLLLFVICTIQAKPQFVTIPDANFRAYLQQLVPTCFTNDLLDTTCTTLSTITEIDCSYKQVSDVTGIAYFKSLTSFRSALDNINSLPGLPSTVTNLYLAENGFTTLPTLPPHLLSLECIANGLTSLPTLPNTLAYLGVAENSLTTLPTLPTSLQILICSGNKLTSLPTLPSTMYSLSCSDNSGLFCLPKLPLKLTYLDIDSAISCLPNYVPGLAVNAKPNYPICDSNYNPHACTFFRACTWTGIIGSAWEDAGNWDCGFVPNKYTDAIINAGSVIVNSNAIANSLKVNTGATITVNTGFALTLIQ